MCGIAGALWATPVGVDVAAGVARAMSAVLSHRGPDDHGTWQDEDVALGHTRLSILDLSPAGHQPMCDESGRYVMVYNGEVYNYRELRGELEARGRRFRTETDTEILLASFIEWGPSAVSRWNGMWALAIWDRQRRELFASRDRAGKKPLYYAITDTGTFVFGSEIKALRSLGLRFRLDTQAAFDFLTQGTYGHLGGRGFLAGVSQLPPGSSLSVSPGGAPEIAPYWRLPAVPPSERIPYDAAFRSRFRDLLTDAVSLRLRSDVPVGATLSGGLDSSTIVLLVDQLTGGAPLHVFTSLFPGSEHDETPYFEAAVSRLRRPIVHRVVPAADDWDSQLLRVLDHQEEPFGDTSILAHFHLMAAARDAGVPVILSGQGSDELLLGYPSLVNAYLGHLVAHGRLLQAASEWRAWTSRTGRPRSHVLQATLLHSLPLPVRDRVRSRNVARLAEIVSPALRARASMRRFDTSDGRQTLDSYLAQVFTRFSIPHLVHYDDRNGMAFAVEGRMPFLDYRLVELMFSVEYDAIFKLGTTKRVLRESFADLLPPVVRDRRDKIGFHTPLAAWLRASLAWIERVMTPERIQWLGVLNADRYVRRINELRLGSDAAALEVWRGFIYHLWADRFDVSPALDGPATVGTGTRTILQAT